MVVVEVVLQVEARREEMRAATKAVVMKEAVVVQAPVTAVVERDPGDWEVVKGVVAWGGAVSVEAVMVEVVKEV